MVGSSNRSLSVKAPVPTSREKVRLWATFCDIASDGVERGVDVEEGAGELDVLLA